MQDSKANRAIKNAIDSGRIRVNLETGELIGCRGHELKARPGPGGYLRITISDPLSAVPGRIVYLYRKVYVHRLAGYAKFGDALFDDNNTVDHINDNKLDNRGCNLALMKRDTNHEKMLNKGWFPVFVDGEIIALCKDYDDADVIAARHNTVC